MEIGSFIHNIQNCGYALERVDRGELFPHDVQVDERLNVMTSSCKSSQAAVIWKGSWRQFKSPKATAELIHASVGKLLASPVWNREGQSLKYLREVAQAVRLIAKVWHLSSSKIVQLGLDRYLSYPAEFAKPFSVSEDPWSRVYSPIANEAECLSFGCAHYLGPLTHPRCLELNDGFSHHVIDGEHLVVLATPANGLSMDPDENALQRKASRFLCRHASRLLGSYSNSCTLRKNLDEIVLSLTHHFKEKFLQAPHLPKMTFLALRTFPETENHRRVVGISLGDNATIGVQTFEEGIQLQQIGKLQGSWTQPETLGAASHYTAIDQSCPRVGALFVFNRALARILGVGEKTPDCLDIDYLGQILSTNQKTRDMPHFHRRLLDFTLENVKVKHQNFQATALQREQAVADAFNKIMDTYSNADAIGSIFREQQQQIRRKYGPLPSEGLGSFVLFGVALRD